MEYTLVETAEKIQQFADKMGSDYFPLPVILNHFQTASYDFIGENLNHIEKTQQVTDDISRLILSLNLPIIPLSSLSPTGELSSIPLPKRYAAAIPNNYFRLLAYDIVYADGYVCRRADLLRVGEVSIARNNPFREPTKRFPFITQESNKWFVDSGDAIPKIMQVKFCKHPTIANVSQPSHRIINLPNDAIEKILLKTVTSLFSSTGDPRTQASKVILEDSFRKMFK